MTTTAAQTGYDRAEIERALTTDGITALKGAFSPEWADRMREDIEAAFEEAIGREGGAVGRGPNRYYVEIHPEQLRGFLDIVSRTPGSPPSAKPRSAPTTRCSSWASTSRSPAR
jgi:hypothetical protein